VHYPRKISAKGNFKNSKQMHTKEEISRKIKEIEWEDFEVKKAKNSVPKSAWDTVSAFANSRGGFLLFGIEEVDGKFKISGVNKPEKIHNDFITTLRSEKFNTAFSAKSSKKTFQDRTILIYYIPEMPRQAKPIYFNGNIRNTFVRSGGTDQRATKKEIERFVREASESSSDSMVFKEATMNDLRKDTINRFCNMFRNVSQNSNLVSLNSEELLIRKGFLRKDGERIQLTAAAILQFGKDAVILNYFPHFKIDYFEISGTEWGGVGERRWDYRIRSESNLFETYQMIMPRLKIRVPVPFSLKEDNITRDESSPALVSVREAFINLLVHTDYFDRKGASIKVYDNRIELMNGGSLLFDKKLLEDGDISEPRNPIIIRAYRMLNLAEDAGSGFFKIKSNWKKAGFYPPDLDSNRRENYFKLSLKFKIEEKKHAGTKTGPSWDQVRTKLGLSRKHVNKILELCEKPITLKNLQKAFDWKNRTKFKKKFVNPLLEEGLVKMTIPNKPTSPNQKYVVTEKGKRLGGELSEL